MGLHSIDFLQRRHSHARPLSYAQLDREQRAIAARVRASVQEHAQGCVFLSELAPTVTLGRRLADPVLRAQHVQWSSAEFARAGVEVVQTARGGFATYHGPGQWVLFVVDSLERLTGDRRGVRKAVDGMLEGTRAFVEQYAGSARTCHGGELGVWTEQGKVAALGIEIEQGILLHGIALNIYRGGQPFPGINPCGLRENPAELLKYAPSEQEFESLGRAWAESVALELGLSLKTRSG